MEKKNMYYGIGVDGLRLKIAELENVKGHVILHRLESYKMTKPLFTEYGGDNIPSVDVTDLSIQGAQADLEADDFDLMPDYLIDASSDEEIKPQSDLKSQTSDSRPQKADLRQQTSAQTDGVYQFLGNFMLDKGKISISCLEGKSQWQQIRVGKNARLTDLRKRALSDYQLKDPSCHASFLENSDGSHYAIIHQGNFELMTLLNNTARLAFNSKKPLHYQFVEPYEVSLLNIFNLIYSSDADRHSTFLYIGNETKMGVVIKNKSIIKTFPIMVMDTDPQKVREAVMAKLMLEQENSDFPLLENIVLAGDFATNEDIEFYNKKTGYNHRLFELDSYELGRHNIDLRILGSINPNEIPSFVIPLALALRGVLAKSKDIPYFNLLPKKIYDAYNYFTLKWHSILLIFLIIIAALYGNTINLRASNKLSQLKALLNTTRSEIDKNRNFKESIDNLQRQNEAFRQANFQTASIAAGKNSWNIIIERLSDFTNRTPMMWIDNLRTNDNRFSITGKAFHRERITQLAQLFDNGHIIRISETEVAGYPLWDYEIIYPRPRGEEATSIPMPGYLQSYDNYLAYVLSMRQQNQQFFMSPEMEDEQVILPEPVVFVPNTSDLRLQIAEERPQTAVIKPHTSDDRPQTTIVATNKQSHKETPKSPLPDFLLNTPPIAKAPKSENVTAAPITPFIPQVITPPVVEASVVTMTAPAETPSPVETTPAPVESTPAPMTAVIETPVEEAPVVSDPTPVEIPAPVESTPAPMTAAIEAPVEEAPVVAVATPVETPTPVQPNPTPVTPVIETPPPMDISPPTEPEKPKILYSSLSPTQIFDNAKQNYMNHNYTEAIYQLEAYTTLYENGEKIAQAYYLLGEIHYGLNNFVEAVENFHQVYKLQKEKVVEALFFISKAYEGLSDFQSAKYHYNILIDYYPANPIAKTAATELQILNGD